MNRLGVSDLLSVDQRLLLVFNVLPIAFCRFGRLEVCHRLLVGLPPFLMIEGT